MIPQETVAQINKAAGKDISVLYLDPNRSIKRIILPLSWAYPDRIELQGSSKNEVVSFDGIKRIRGCSDNSILFDQFAQQWATQRAVLTGGSDSSKLTAIEKKFIQAAMLGNTRSVLDLLGQVDESAKAAGLIMAARQSRPTNLEVVQLLIEFVPDLSQLRIAQKHAKDPLVIDELSRELNRQNQ